MGAINETRRAALNRGLQEIIEALDYEFDVQISGRTVHLSLGCDGEDAPFIRLSGTIDTRLEGEMPMEYYLQPAEEPR